MFGLDACDVNSPPASASPSTPEFSSRERLPPQRQVRAVYDSETIVVYQAYRASIASPAVKAQRFVPPFSPTRMTWIKPSFLWMMYRSGWATKPGQEHVLAVRVSRAGFEEALANACLSHFDPDVYADQQAWKQRSAATPVRVQWDPERDVQLKVLPWRSLQVGIGGGAVASYIDRWTIGIEDVTPLARQLHHLPATKRSKLLPPERPYPLPLTVAAVIGTMAVS